MILIEAGVGRSVGVGSVRAVVDIVGTHHGEWLRCHRPSAVGGAVRGLNKILTNLHSDVNIDGDVWKCRV